MDGDFSVLDFFTVLLRKKRKLLIHLLASTLLAVLASLIIPKKFKSTTIFLPPQGESMGMPSMAALGLGFNLNNDFEFTPQQVETLLDSRLILEQIIEKYDLMTVYKTKKKPNNLEAALKILRSNTKLRITTESGLTQNTVVHYALSIIDKNRERSAAIANDMISLLNHVMETLSRQQEDYTVTFIRSRLDSVVSQKSGLQKDLADFQKTYKIYAPDMKEQILASVGTIAELKKQKMLSEIERDLLLIDRENSNHEVRIAQKKVSQLTAKINAIENNRSADVLPGLNFSVDIAYKYLEMVKEQEILSKLELLLRQQYEEAKIKDARRAPMVRVVDRAVPPQWKNSPKKSLIVLISVGLYMFFYTIILLGGYGLSHSSEATRKKVGEFKAALKL
jgi:tyrosine-protein kinase Etk/Wzc